MKRLLIVLLFVVLLTGCTANTAPPAASPTMTPTETTPEATTDTSPAATSDATSAGVAPVRATYTGIVDSVNGSDISLKETGSETVTVVITTSNETAIIDIQTARAAELSAIQAGNTITAVTRPITATSEPPQAPALAVLVNPTTDPIPPTYAVVTAIEQKDAETWITTDADVVWIVTANTPITALNDGATVALNTITTGAKLVGWYQVTTRSMPAQARPDKIVVVP